MSAVVASRAAGLRHRNPDPVDGEDLLLAQEIAARAAVAVVDGRPAVVAAIEPGDPEVLGVLDAGYDAPCIAHLLDGLPVEILGRLRSDRVMRRPAPSRKEFSPARPEGGRPPKHGGGFVFGDPATWGTEQAVTTTDTRLHGRAIARAWDRLHPRLTRRAAWLDHDGPLPIIEGSGIRMVGSTSSRINVSSIRGSSPSWSSQAALRRGWTRSHACVTALPVGGGGAGHDCRFGPGLGLAKRNSGPRFGGRPPFGS